VFEKTTTKQEGVAYLFEFLHIYVELATEFGLSMRECGDLGSECSATSSFCVCPLSLDLMFGTQIGYLSVFVAEH
jgi:hypothetical protein